MTSNAKWGVIVVAVAVILGIVWTAGGRFWPAPGQEQTSASRTAAVSTQGDDATPADTDTSSTQRSEGQSTSPSDEQSEEAAAGGEHQAPSDKQSEASPGPGQQPPSDNELQEEAEAYVSRLAEPLDEPVRLDGSGAFVGADRPLAAGGSDQAAGREASQDGASASGRGRSGEQQSAVIDRDVIEGVPRMEVAAVAAEVPPAPPAGTADDVKEASPPPDGGTAGDGVPADTDTDNPERTRVDLPLTEETPITVAQLLGPEEDIPPGAVFYVHTVQPDNDQGIWGIVHTGIVENFAQGVAIHRGSKTSTYRVDIPRNADERKADNSSSFLGKLIHSKTTQSYVYNFETDRIGRNPDLIIPGQEIVIVSFTPEELIAVYKHFARQEG